MISREHAARLLFSDAKPQSQHSSEDVAIRNLFNDRDLYDHYPDFQRGGVWPDKYKYALIDSILRGFPIHPLLAYRELDSDGKEKNFIVDGRQRLTTIYEFMAGKFTTPSKVLLREEGRIVHPVDPRRHFHELSERAKNIFLSYKFTINVIEGFDKTEVAALFRRIQHQVPLKASEKLASYSSDAIKCAIRLQDNPLWMDMYTGGDLNKQIFQANLMLIALELAQGYTSLKSSQLNRLASGARDELITEAFCERIESRIETTAHVFEGSAFSMRTAAIPMYQAIMFLENQGHVFTSSDQGRFTPWFGQVVYEADKTGMRGFSHPMTMLQNINSQQEFWEVNLPIITDICKKAE